MRPHVVILGAGAAGMAAARVLRAADAVDVTVPERVTPGHLEIAELLRGGDMDAIHCALHEHLSIDDMELHMHPASETLRHGRSEAAARS